MSEKVTLTNLNDGLVEEQFNRELSKVLANISDLNTSPSETREINIKFKVKPHDDRAAWAMKIEVTSKMAPQKGFIVPGYFDIEKGKVVAVEKKAPPNISDLLNQDAKQHIRDTNQPYQKVRI